MVSKNILPFGIQVPRLFNNIIETDEIYHREKVYVIGNGWGTYYFVKNLDKKKFEPVIIAPNLKVLNTPKLTNLIIDPNAKVEFENPHGEIIIDMVEDINIEKKNIITKSGNIYPYNRVILSIGSEPNDFGINGVNTYTYKLKTIQDANLLREKLKNISINEQIYIIGSGITGIEIASKVGKNFNVKVIEGLELILPGYNEKTKSVIIDHINKTQKNIKIETNTLVKCIEGNFIKVLKTKSNEINDLNFDFKKNLIIWSGGIRFNGYGTKSKLFNTLNQISLIKPRGIEVNEDFSIGKDLEIYCIGDMVSNKGPPSAQNAKIQGEYLAKYFNSGLDKNFIQINKFESRSKGKLVHLTNDIYLESEYYSGFIPKLIDNIIEWFNI